MKLDDAVFAAELTVLQDRFARQGMTLETQMRYYDFLAAELSTEEFVAACREIFNQDTYWPSPQRFLDAVRGNIAEVAAGEWEEILRLMRAGSHDLSSLSDAGRAALRTAGGWREVVAAPTEFALEAVGKRFMGAYTRAASAATRPQLEKPEPVVLEALQ